MARITVEVDIDDFDDAEVLRGAVDILNNSRRGPERVRKQLQSAIYDITGEPSEKNRNLLDALKMEICEMNLDRRTLDEIEQFFNGVGDGN